LADANPEMPVAELIEENSRARMCNGKLLLRVRLVSDEVAWVTEPPPLFRLASRLAYLPSFFEDVYKNFQSYLDPVMCQSYDIWFDYNGVPLKWHYPIGALCDVLVGSDVPVPLDLTVHFRGCPLQELLPYSDVGDWRDAVMSAWQQAVFLQHQKASVWGRCPQEQQRRLWDAIKAADLKDVASVQRDSGLLCPTLGGCRHLAVRLHISSQTQRHAVLLHPAPALEDRRPTTVQDLLRQVLPPLFPEPAGAPPLEGIEIVTHGIRVPPDTPLYWLSLNSMYLDSFVHLAIRLPCSGVGPSSTPSSPAGGGRG